MNYYLDSLAKFNQLPLSIRQKVSSQETLLFINALERQYDLDLKFLVVLVMIGELAVDDIPEYLKAKYGLKESDGGWIKNQMLRNVFRELVDEGYREGKNIRFVSQAKDILTNQLKDVLLGKDNLRIEANAKLIYNFTFGQGLTQEQALEILERNNQQLTDQPIVVNGQELESTISHWLDHLKSIGMFKEEAGNFRNRLEFFNQDKNFLSLNDWQKQGVRRLIELYRHLKFFPLSFGSLPVDDWKFIPLSGDYDPEEEEMEIKIEASHKNASKQSKSTNQPASQPLQDLFKDQVATLQEKYKFNEGISSYKNQNQAELVKILEVSDGPEIVLPILSLLSDKDPKFVSLLNNAQIMKKFNISEKNLKNLFKTLLSKLGLNDQEAKIFIFNLSKKNKNLVGLVYGNLKTQSFDWA